LTISVWFQVNAAPLFGTKIKITRDRAKADLLKISNQ
jgi:hypothetical protein